MSKYITKDQIQEIRRRRAALEPLRTIAADLGVSPATVSRYGRRLRKCNGVSAVSVGDDVVVSRPPDNVMAWLNKVTEQSARIAKLQEEMDELVQHAVVLQQLLREASE